jgi:hypothetical protein
MVCRGMANVVRIAFLKMLVLFRLVMIASLAAYSLPTVSFAMHGDASSSYSVQSATVSDHHSSVDEQAAVDADHHDHGMTDQTADRDTKPIKQDCCSDFCLSLAIVAEGYFAVSAAPLSLYTFSNDQTVFGQLTSLHRPPSFRA